MRYSSYLTYLLAHVFQSLHICCQERSLLNAPDGQLCDENCDLNDADPEKGRKVLELGAEHQTKRRAERLLSRILQITIKMESFVKLIGGILLWDRIERRNCCCAVDEAGGFGVIGRVAAVGGTCSLVGCAAGSKTLGRLRRLPG